MEDHQVLSTLEEIKAFSDPYRLQILSTYKELNRPATVKEIADKLKQTPAKVHYHVKKLEKVKILKLVETKEINGIIAKYYLPTADRFIIKSTSQNEELSKVILNETQRVIDNIYENSKKVIINEIAYAKFSKDDDHFEDDHDESIHSATIYLTKEDCYELNEFINKLTNRKVKNEKTRKYHLFTVLFPISEEE